MKRETNTRLLHFAAIALGPVFILPTVVERKSMMVYAVDNSGISRYAERWRRSRLLDIACSVLQLLLAAAFLFGGVTKLASAHMHGETVATIEMGKWVRWVTGGFEIIAAILIMIPTTVAVGAALLVVMAIAAIDTHLFVIGGSSVPALVLLPLAAAVAWYRDRLGN